MSDLSDPVRKVYEKWHREDLDEVINFGYADFKQYLNKKLLEFTYKYDDWADCWPSTYPRKIKREKFIKLFFQYLLEYELTKESVSNFLHYGRFTDSCKPNQPEAELQPMQDQQLKDASNLENQVRKDGLSSN